MYWYSQISQSVSCFMSAVVFRGRENKYPFTDCYFKQWETDNLE